MFLYSIDIFFVLDIVMNFITAFEDSREIVIDDRCSIIINYLTGWFIVDFVSIFPIDLVFSIYEYSSTSENFNRFFRIMRFFRLFSLRQIHHLKPTFEYLQLYIHFNKKTIKNTRFVYEQAEELILILGVFLVTSHYIASIWIFVGHESKSEKFYDSVGKLTSNDWITNGGFLYLTKQ